MLQKVDIADYKPDVKYKPEGSDPEMEPVDHEEEEQNSDAEYVKVELPCQGTMKQNQLTIRLQKELSMYNKHKDLRFWPCGSRT